MTNYCLECGGELAYDIKLKQYACKNCGLTFTFQQLMEGKDKLIESYVDEDQKKRKQKEYLQWWLSKK